MRISSNSNGASGSQIKAVAASIGEHGCKVCGSVPLGFPGTNDVKNGELKFNFVRDTRGCGNTQPLC